MEKFKLVLQFASSKTNLFAIFEHVLENIQQIIDCSSIQIFLFSNEGLETRPNPCKINQQRTVLEKRYIEALVLEENLSTIDPQFKKQKEALVFNRTINYMSAPLFKQNGEIYLALQVIANKKKSNQKFSKGFTNVDEIMLQMLTSVLQIKIHEVISKLEMLSI